MDAQGIPAHLVLQQSEKDPVVGCILVEGPASDSAAENVVYATRLVLTIDPGHGLRKTLELLGGDEK